MNYNIETGSNLKFKPIGNLPDGLTKFLKESLNELQSIEAFTLINRRIGLFGLKKIMTLVLFYNDPNQYERDNVTLTSDLENYFKTQTYLIDLMAFDMNIEFSLSLVQEFEEHEIEVIRINKNAQNKTALKRQLIQAL